MKKRLLIIALCVGLIVPFSFPHKSGAFVGLLIPFIATAARVVVQSVVASAPMVLNLAARTVSIPLTSSKAMNVALGASVAVHAAALAIGLGYKALASQPATSACSVTASWPGSRPYNGSYPSVSAALAAATAGGQVGSLGPATPNGGGMLYDWDWGDGTFSYNVINATGGCDVPARSVEDVMWLDLQANPTQANTDKFLGGLKVLAPSKPTDFDAIVTLSDKPNNQGPSDYPNGSTQSVSGGTISVISGPAGTPTLDSVGDLLVDGQSPTTGGGVGGGVGGGTGGGGGGGGTTSGGATSADIQKVVDAVKNKQTDCDKHPNSAGCADLGTATSPTLTSTPVDFSTLHLSPITLVLDNKVCPAPDTVMVHGQSVTINNQPLCDVLGWIRPAILASAWFSSIMLIIGAIRT